jgi:hypothetical protein
MSRVAGTSRRFTPHITAVALIAAGLAACGASARSTGVTAPASAAGAGAGAAVVSAVPPGAARATPCGAAAPEALARAAGVVAQRIYAGELAGAETRSDQRQVEDFTPLLSAVAAGERGAVNEAVTSLVFSHTHVVRLRVTRGGNVLADVGGPYILAPVGGSLRFHGQTVGHYLLSVQDDLGYVKLETRFIGAPLLMRQGSHPVPVEGLLAPGPASIPAHGPVSYRHVGYEAYSFNASSFPSGPLRISLLLHGASSLSKRTCAQIRTAELGLVAQRIAARYALSPSNFASYMKLTTGLTGALLYIRSGSHQLAGSTHPGPAHLPKSGSVTYRGVRYGVASFGIGTSAGFARVYALAR